MFVADLSFRVWVIYIIFLPNDFLFKRQEGHLLLALLTLGPEGITSTSTASLPYCRTGLELSNISTIK